MDHVAVYHAARSLQRAGAQVLFYEDVPYAIDPARLAERLSSLPDWYLLSISVDQQSLEAKVQAIACYTSQVGVLLGSAGAMETSIRGFARTRGSEQGAAERYWTAEDPRTVTWPPGLNTRLGSRGPAAAGN